MPDCASPQLENGYTRIADELLEAICRSRAPAGVIRLMLAVIRETYGYGTKMKPIRRDRLAEIMGVHEAIARKHLRAAKDWNMVIVTGWQIGPQKDYTQWVKPTPRRRENQTEPTQVQFEANRPPVDSVSNLASGDPEQPSLWGLGQRQIQDTGTSKATPSADAEANKARAECIKQVWNACGLDGSPPGRIFAKLKNVTEGRNHVLRELADHARGNGLRCPEDEKSPAWFFAMVKEKAPCPEGVGWRKRPGGNGRQEYEPGSDPNRRTLEDVIREEQEARERQNANA